jgi:hypothetical protein
VGLELALSRPHIVHADFHAQTGKRQQQMRHLIPAALPALLFAACEPKGLTTDAPRGVSTISNCDTKVETAWLVDAANINKVEAMTAGPTCEKAVVFLAVRAADGTPLLAWSGRATDIFGLHDAPDVNTMKPSLQAWIDQAESPFKMTSAMPEWSAGRDRPGPADQEFPFHPEGWLERDGWEKIRAENAPVFTFAQGRESEAVYVLHNDQLELVGVQQFPG